ncbi:MAG: CHAD domain-containing protein [Hyphomicrobium sp.]|nr:CHAD domain-containing protein [Hyphomicrobium sp.]
MAFRLKLGHRIEKEARRLLLEQTERALGELGAAGDLPRTIHETRKCMKRIRSLLRLLKPGLKPAWFAAEDRRYRTAARMLSQLRDSHVTLQTLAKLEQASDEKTREALGAARGIMSPTSLEGPIATDPQAILAETTVAISAGRSAAAKLELRRGGIETLACGYAAILADGKRRFKAQRKAPTDEGLHELRKAVQHHWRHLQILSSAWPELFEVRIATAKAIADQLGTDHDLSVLAAALEDLPVDTLPERQRDLVLARVRMAQNDIRHSYVPLARRLFADSPDGMANALCRQWRAAGRARADRAETWPEAENVTSIGAAKSARRAREDQKA